MLAQLREAISDAIGPDGREVPRSIEGQGELASLLTAAGLSGEPVLAEVLGRALNSPAHNIRATACQQLGDLGSAASTQAAALLAIVRGAPRAHDAMGDPQGDLLSFNAAIALRSIPSDVVARGLLSDLEHEDDPQRRKLLASALLGSVDLPQVRALIDAFLEGRGEELWRRGEVVDAVLRSQAVDQWTLQTLGAIARDGRASGGERMNAVDGLQRFLHDGVDATLQEGARAIARELRADRDLDVSAQAAAVVGELEREQVLAVHRARLDEGVPIQRDGAAGMLAQMGDEASAERIAAMLVQRVVGSSPGGTWGLAGVMRTYRRNGQAADVLEALGRTLVQHAEGEDLVTAAGAIEVIGLVGDTAHIDALHRILVDPERHPRARMAAATALGSLRDPRASELLATTSTELYEAERRGDLSGMSFDEMLHLQSAIRSAQRTDLEPRGRDPREEALAWLAGDHTFPKPPVPESAKLLRGDDRQEVLSAALEIIAGPRRDLAPWSAIELVTGIGDDGAVFGLVDVVADRTLTFDRRVRAHLAQRKILARLDREVGRVVDLDGPGRAQDGVPSGPVGGGRVRRREVGARPAVAGGTAEVAGAPRESSRPTDERPATGQHGAPPTGRAGNGRAGGSRAHRQRGSRGDGPGNLSAGF